MARIKLGSLLIYSISFTIFMFLNICSAKRNKDVYCGACLALIDEMTWDISQVDPKKKIQVGSFRIDSKGNQDLQEIPLARSGVHLTELLENVCEKMSNYAVTTNDEGRRSYIRTNSRDGSSVSLTNIQISGEVHSQLKYACETLVEDHEEELVPSFQVGLDDMSEIICVDLMDVCTKTNITDFESATKALRTSPTKETDDDEEDDEEEEEEETQEQETRGEL